MKVQIATVTNTQATRPPAMCACCWKFFQPDRHRELCDQCHRAIPALASKSRVQLDSMLNDRQVEIRRIELAKRWPF